MNQSRLNSWAEAAPLCIQYEPVESLLTPCANLRHHPQTQIRNLVQSIDRFGFNNPVLLDAKGRVLAGHARLLAAKELGLNSVPTIQLQGLSPTQCRAYRLADNQLSEGGRWNRNALASEITSLLRKAPRMIASALGFEAGQIDALLEIAGQPSNSSRPAPEQRNLPIVSKPGDLWQVGPHRLLCGDATTVDAFKKLLGRQQAQLVFTDPPYNLSIRGHVAGLGRTQHREFPMASGELSDDAFEAFLRSFMTRLVSFSTDGAIHFICMDWRHAARILAAGRGLYSELKSLCVWNKDAPGMGSLYRSKHELVFAYKVGRSSHINNVQLGRFGRCRSNVWDYPRPRIAASDRHLGMNNHPTPKPVELVADAIRDCSVRGGIVLDCFAGTGTTLVAAELTGRRGFGIELDPQYVDTAVRWLQEATGKRAIHAISGKPFPLGGHSGTRKRRG